MTRDVSIHDGSGVGLGPGSLSRLQHWAADPSLVVSDGRFFVYPTSDGYPGWSSGAFHVYSSSDLNQWTDEGEVLRLGRDVRWAQTRAWAPAVLVAEDRWVLFYTAEGGFIGVATAHLPTGPFVDIGKPLISPGSWPGTAIDPSTFCDLDGKTYLIWGNGVLNIAALNEDLISFDASQVVSSCPQGFTEAGFIHRRKSVYYLSWSSNDTRSPDYSVWYATGSSPLGPWTFRGPLLRKDEPRGVLGTGHHCIVQLPGTDQWLIGYHAFAPGSDGYHRAVRFDWLTHRADGLLDEVVPGDAARPNIPALRR